MGKGILVQNDADRVLVDVVGGQCRLSSCHERLEVLTGEHWLDSWMDEYATVYQDKTSTCDHSM